MAKWRQAVELAMTDEEINRLAAIARSRSEPARRVERARMLLAYCESPTWRSSSDRPTLRRTGAGLWPVGGTRRPAATRQGTDDYAGGQGLAGVFGV